MLPNSDQEISDQEHLRRLEMEIEMMKAKLEIIRVMAEDIEKVVNNPTVLVRLEIIQQMTRG
jgi:hypothetical protein